MSVQPHFPQVSMQLTWRPSRWVIAASLAMGIAGAFAICVSGVPTSVQAPLAACALLWALSRALLEHRRPPRVFVVRSDASATLDAMPLVHHRVRWRGPLAFLRARDAQGRVHRLAFWPDTLDARGRRALRLSSPATRRGRPLAVSPRSMRG